MRTVVLTRRWPEHSAGHGLALGKDILKAQALARQADLQPPVPKGFQPQRNFIAASVTDDALQVVEAYDVSQGPEWADGLNRLIPANVLVADCQANVRKDRVCHRASSTRRGGGGGQIDLWFTGRCARGTCRQAVSIRQSPLESARMIAGTLRRRHT